MLNYTILQKFYSGAIVFEWEFHGQGFHAAKMAIVAEIKQNTGRRFIGIVRLIVEPDFKKGEVAVMGHDDYQGKGLACKLRDMVIGIVQEKVLQVFLRARPAGPQENADGLHQAEHDR